MAGNTRGRIKERLEGMHKNFDWLEEHCNQIVVLIDGRTPALTEAIESLAKEILELDKLTQGLYSTI